MVRRTKKEFKDYNEYHDRPFGLKWGTAYALDDLMKAVHQNEEEEMKDNPALPETSREEMDAVLYEAWTQHLPVRLQLNQKDRFGRYYDCITGYFNGESDDEGFYIDDQKYLWEDVRHLSLLDAEKWSKLD